MEVVLEIFLVHVIFYYNFFIFLLYFCIFSHLLQSFEIDLVLNHSQIVSTLNRHLFQLFFNFNYLFYITRFRGYCQLLFPFEVNFTCSFDLFMRHDKCFNLMVEAVHCFQGNSCVCVNNIRIYNNILFEKIAD